MVEKSQIIGFQADQINLILMHLDYKNTSENKLAENLKHIKKQFEREEKEQKEQVKVDANSQETKPCSPTNLQQT